MEGLVNQESTLLTVRSSTKLHRARLWRHPREAARGGHLVINNFKGINKNEVVVFVGRVTTFGPPGVW